MCSFAQNCSSKLDPISKKYKLIKHGINDFGYKVLDVESRTNISWVLKILALIKNILYKRQVYFRMEIRTYYIVWHFLPFDWIYYNKSFVNIA